MPDPRSISSFVLYAERSLILGERDRVTGGDLGIRSRAERKDGSQLRIGSDSVAGQGHYVISPSVTLGRHVRVGQVQTDALVDDGIRLGAEEPFPAADMPALPLAPVLAAGGTAVTVPANQVDSLVPGSYADLTVSGSLVLNPGDYVFSKVTIGDGARIVSVGAVRIRIAMYLTAGRGARLHPLFGQPASQLEVFVSGTDETAARPVVSFGERARAGALLNAPHGTISLADYAEISGAVSGFDVAVGAHVRILFEGGFPQNPPDQHGSQQLPATYGVPAGPATAPLAGPVPPDAAVSLAIGLPVKDPSGLQAFIRDVSDPHSPQFRQHISQADFCTTYGAAEQDYQALRDWAGASGFTITATYPSNLLLSVRGTAAQVEQALYVNLIHRLRADGSQFVAADRVPSLNLSVPVLEITGLGDVIAPHPQNGTGAGGTFRAADLRNAYLGVGSAHQALDGTGQVVGIVGFDTFAATDIAGYAALQLPVEGQPALPAPNVTVTVTEGGNPVSGSNEEATLDVEAVYAMAPGATILFFQGSTGITGHLDDILHAMANSNPALTVASSSLEYGASDNAQQALDQMAAQGVSYFQSSGDSGDTGTNDQHHRKMNNQTLVGGTILATNPLTAGLPAPVYPSPYYAGEDAWPDSGGGIMNGVPIPDYQKGIMAVSAAANGGSTTERNYPDVALLAQDFEIFFSGATTVVAGTSVAAPLWAGFTALVNQRSMQNGAGLAGFLNPTFYDIGLTAGSADDVYAISFHDIADGVSNGVGGGGSGFTSVPGYDLVTGLGTPTSALIDQLASTTPLTPDEPLTIIRFVITTGADDLGGGLHGSSATANVFLNDGSSFTVTLRDASEPNWDNGSTHTRDFAIPATVTPPLTQSNGIAGAQINLVQDNPDWSADNWDIASLGVSLLNPGSPPVCQLNLVGTAQLQDGSTGLVRLSKSAGSSGSGPMSPVFKTGPDSGC
jgi:Pro-kumamolisin, activation domain